MGAAKKQNITQLMIQEKIVSATDLQKAKELQKKEGGNLTSNLVRIGAVKEQELAEFVAKSNGLPLIDLRSFEIPAEVINMVSANICRKLKVIPTSKFENRLVVAFANPDNYYAIEDLSHVTRCKIDVVVAPESMIMETIEKYYGDGAGSDINKVMSQFEELESDINEDDLIDDADLLDGDEFAGESPIINFVNHMLSDAISRGASDIHIEPFEKRFRIRYRVDGGLIEAMQPPPDSAAAIISRVKIISKMDISERRRPQDGRIRVKRKGKEPVDFRVNSIPTMFGESIVLRLLDKSNLTADLDTLGFEPSQFKMFYEAINQPQGMVLVTGPTGSGKTTTLYSAIKELNQPGTKILTAENPIEFNFEGIVQTQINHTIDYNFSDALRAFLRQDPEVILVGEIRDLETAEISYKAAATGHMVLSTLHTNDAASTVTRLLDMGLPSYVVADSTSLIVAQRLMRKVCNNCKAEDKVEDQTLLDLGIKQEDLPKYAKVYKGQGCPQCSGTGLQGRIPIFEVLKITGLIRAAILKGVAPMELKQMAIQNDHMITLRQSALIRLKAGLVSIDQVIDSSMADDEI